MVTDNKKLIDKSVQRMPQVEEQPGSSWIVALATIADDIQPWGRSPELRDRQLREFWHTEPTLASAIYTIVGRNAAFSWTLEGPGRTVEAVQSILHKANFGKGWLDFVIKLTTDLFTTDNGGFIELIRLGNSPTSPVIGISHLDSGRCQRTGVLEWPVIYTDRYGARHKMAPHQVISVEEFPSPIETMNGVQLCAVSRVLRMAQLLRDISIYNREKVSGTKPKSLYITSGIKSSEINDAIKQHQELQLERGYIRYLAPLIMGTLDPDKPVSVAEIPIAGLPDGFDMETMMRWYINLLAMGFGADYQDFAPLPGRGIGSGAQALVLHMKSRGKGPALFMKTLEHIFNFHGVIPQNVTFKYDEQDVAEDMEQANLRRTRAETDKIYIETGVLTPEAVRQEMLDQGDISQEVFDSLQEEPDITPDVVAHDEERVEDTTKEASDDFEGEERVASEIALERDMRKVLDNIFDKIKKKIGYKGIGFKAGPEDLLTDDKLWNEFRVEAVSAMNPHVRKGALEAAQFNANLGLAVNMDLVNSEVLDFTRTFTNQWWSGIESTTRDGMRKALVSWQETGLGKRGMPDLVDAMKPLFGPARAKRIAVTETTRIFDEGNKLAHLSAGIETEEWQTSKDEKVCPICEPLDGKKFPTVAGPRPVTDTHVS